MDAKEDQEYISSSASSVAESDDNPCVPVEGTNSATSYTAAGRVYRLNSRRNHFFRGALGVATRRNGITLQDQWIDERFQTADDLTFATPIPSEEIALMSPKTTDLLRIRPVACAPGITFDPLASSGGVKAAYYSAAFILRSAAAERLDIDPEEFDISNVRQVELTNGTMAGEIVINDHLANGAGFTSWLDSNWLDILNLTTSTSEHANTFIGALTAPVHRECESSGYDCLRQFRNMSYHGLLDWRLGLCLLRALRDLTFVIGLDSHFDTPELIGWIDFAVRLRDSFLRSFPQCRLRDYGPLPGFTVGNRQVIIVHPLWDAQQPQGIFAQARAACGDGIVCTLDTFNLLRREGWAYRSLASFT